MLSNSETSYMKRSPSSQQFLAGKVLKLSDLNVLREQWNGSVCRMYFERLQCVRTDKYVIIPFVLYINSCSPSWLAAVDCVVFCLAVVFRGYSINTPSSVATRSLWNRKPNGRAVGTAVTLFARFVWRHSTFVASSKKWERLRHVGRNCSFILGSVAVLVPGSISYFLSVCSFESQAITSKLVTASLFHVFSISQNILMQ
jgi:hypothetical protein